MEIQRFRTLEKLIQSWNPGLYIEEIPDDPECDRVMFSDGKHQKYVCAVPKGGKHLSWLSMIADSQSQSDMTSDALIPDKRYRVPVRHRGMDGLVLTLIKKGYITWETCKRFFGDKSDVSKYVKGE